MTARKRIILECDEGNEILAVRAAKPVLFGEQGDGIVGFVNGVEFYVRLTKSGVSARQLP